MGQALSGRRGVVAASALAVAILIVCAQTGDAHNCTCINKGGARYQLGQMACLHVDGKSYLARCEMKLNVSSWTRVQDSCPVASLATPAQSNWVH